jgi:hypothetical protein
MASYNGIEYSIYKCLIHKKTIHYYKSHNHITGKFHCWDCSFEHDKANAKPYKSEVIIEEIQEEVING